MYQIPIFIYPKLFSINYFWWTVWITTNWYVNFFWWFECLLLLNEMLLSENIKYVTFGKLKWILEKNIIMKKIDLSIASNVWNKCSYKSLKNTKNTEINLVRYGVMQYLWNYGNKKSLMTNVFRWLLKYSNAMGELI